MLSVEHAVQSGTSTFLSFEPLNKLFYTKIAHKRDLNSSPHSMTCVDLNCCVNKERRISFRAFSPL